MRIAVIDTDAERAKQICSALAAIGHACHRLAPESVPEHARRDEFDLLILDWQASHANDAVSAFRSWLPAGAPVLLMAERADEDELTRLLDATPCDYILKPLRLGELAVRVQVLLKRAFPALAAGEQIVFDPYTFETATGRITKAGRAIDITQKEFELALLFFRHLGRPLSRTYIQEAIWSHDPNMASRTMDTHVSRVRSKLGLRPENGFRLSPVYGYGYQLERAGE